MRKLSVKQLDALEQCASVRRAELREFRANTIQSLIELDLIDSEVTGCGADSDCAQHGDGTTIAADQPCSGTWLYFVTKRGVAWLTSQRETAVVWDAPTKADQRVQNRYTGRIVTVTKIQPDNGVVYVSTDSDLGGHVNAFRVIDDSTPLEEIVEPVVTAEAISEHQRVDTLIEDLDGRPADPQEAPVHDGPMAQQHRAEYHDSNGRCFLYGDACAVPGKGPTELAVWLKPGVVLTPSEYSGRVFRFVDWRRGGAYVRNVATGQGRLVVQSEIVLWKHLPEQNAGDWESEKAVENELCPPVCPHGKTIDQPCLQQPCGAAPERHELRVECVATRQTFVFEGTENLGGLGVSVYLRTRLGRITARTLDHFVGHFRAVCSHLYAPTDSCPNCDAQKELRPRFPRGTPEYERYADKLRVELDKFAKGEPPYQFNEGWLAGSEEHKPTAPVPGSTDHVRVLTEQRDAAEQALNRLRERLSWLLGRHNYEPGIPLEYIREALEETR